jgi:hypothetical protein
MPPLRMKQPVCATGDARTVRIGEQSATECYGRILSRKLFGVSGLDPLAHGGALLLFALVAAAAAAPSLRRALRVDPISMLRHE